MPDHVHRLRHSHTSSRGSRFKDRVTSQIQLDPVLILDMAHSDVLGRKLLGFIFLVQIDDAGLLKRAHPLRPDCHRG